MAQRVKNSQFGILAVIAASGAWSFGDWHNSVAAGYFMLIVLWLAIACVVMLADAQS